VTIQAFDSRRAVLRHLTLAAVAAAVTLLAPTAAGADSGTTAPSTSPASATAAPSATTPPATTVAAPSPTATSGASSTQAKPQAPASGVVTATFEPYCDGYGFDVSNGTAVAHTVTLTPGGAVVIIDPGATVHIPLDVNTAGDEVILTDTTDDIVLWDKVVRFCIAVVDHSVTIKANTSYTLNTMGGLRAAPSPSHGRVEFSANHSGTLTYTPDPCFAGVDRFGYTDFITSEEGTVTVTVQVGTCRLTVMRSALDCTSRTVSYKASNPYALPARMVWNGDRSAHNGAAVVAAHASVSLVTLNYGSGSRPDRVTFRVGETSQILLADHISFPCPAVLDSAVPGLGATGVPTRPLISTAGCLLLAGTVLLIASRRRNASS
jgi:hypothetical protein